MEDTREGKKGLIDPPQQDFSPGQSGRLEVANLAGSYIEEKTTGKDIPLPLSPSPKKLFAFQKKEKEEEKKKNVFCKKERGFQLPSKKSFDGFGSTLSSPREENPSPLRSLRETTSSVLPFRRKPTTESRPEGKPLPELEPSSQASRHDEGGPCPSCQHTSQKNDLNEILTHAMIDMWNKSVQKALDKPPVFSTHRRRHQLLDMLHDLFKGDLAHWQAYCKRLTRSRFLMGANESGFKVTLDWALNPDNAVKVLEGALYDPPLANGSPSASAKKQEEEDFFASLQEHCLEESRDPQWYLFCEKLARLSGVFAYKAWFKGVIPLTFSAEDVTLGLPNALTKERLDRDWKPALQKALEGVFPGSPSLTLIDLTRRPSYAR